MVVDDRDLDGYPVEGTGDQFLIGHLETAVAVDAPHHFVGLRDLGAHGRGHTESHGSRTPGGEPFHGLFMGKEMGRPHLMLTDPCDVDAVSRAELSDALDDLLRRQFTVWRLLPARLVALLDLLQRLHPGGIVGDAIDFISQQGERLAAIAHDGDIHRPVLADLGGVDIGVDDFRARREGVQFACDPVVKAGADGNDQV